MIADVPFLFDIFELITEQNDDTDISNAIKYLQQNRINFDIDILGSLKRFRKKIKIYQEGILTWNNKIVVPLTLRKRVLELCHDHPLSGHFASERTWLRTSKKYFWPNAKDDVVNWVRSCKTCNAFNTPYQGYVKRPLVPIETTERFELVCYDLAGPFMPKTERGMIYVLIIVDHFSKWPEVVALPDSSAPRLLHKRFMIIGFADMG